MFAQVGSCVRCGAPIYAPAVWHGVTPPPSTHSCTCFAAQQTVTTTSTRLTPYEYETTDSSSKGDKND